MVGVALWLCYILSKYLSKKIGNSANTANMKVIDRIILGQDKSLVIARICDKIYLLSVSSKIEILKELDESELVLPKHVEMANFKSILNDSMKKFSKNRDKGENSDEK